VVKRPAAPAGILAVTRSWWGEFWTSRLAALVEATDVAALRRLATLYDERERCYRSAQKGRLVEGSMGQMVLNPLYKHLGVLDVEIRQLEDRFGLTPMARLKLGVQFGEASRSLEDLNRIATLDVAEEEDPRSQEPRRVPSKTS
jgi:P27 family predicted phage terminase small subunit